MSVLKNYIYHDQGTGMPAFSVDIPAGWSVFGGISWDANNPIFPAIIHFIFSSPTGEAYSLYPNLSFYWSESPLSKYLLKPGSRFETHEVCRPPATVQEFAQLLATHYIGDPAILNLKVTDARALDDLSLTAAAGQESTINDNHILKGVKVRFEYDTLTRMEEEIYCVYEAFIDRLKAPFVTVTNTVWAIDYVYSFRAEKGKLDAHMDTFRQIFSSFRINRMWLSQYKQITDQIKLKVTRQKQQQTAAQINQAMSALGQAMGTGNVSIQDYINKNNQDMLNMMKSSNERRQQAMDRANQQWDDYIRQ